MRDKLLFGQLQVSAEYLQMLSPDRASCRDFVAIKEFQDGEVDARELGQRFPVIQCIRIVIGAKQRTWISISEFAVFAIQDSALPTTPGEHSTDTSVVAANGTAVVAISATGKGTVPVKFDAGDEHKDDPISSEKLGKNHSVKIEERRFRYLDNARVRISYKNNSAIIPTSHNVTKQISSDSNSKYNSALKNNISTDAGDSAMKIINSGVSISAIVPFEGSAQQPITQELAELMPLRTNSTHITAVLPVPLQQ